ncbi:MAG: hypothetical protein MJ211_12215 [Bacteroidales bacterium]|nr:hypothetical protein [Bacteroidales bacterium]
MNLKHWFGQSVLGRKYFRTFKKEFMTPYNYKYSYKQIKDNYWSFKSENAYWNYMEQNYPITLDSIYNVFYQKEAEKIMTRLNKLDVSELIYSLGLLDLETNIQLFTSISDDYKHYSENEIILAKMASARLGDKKSEDYLLSDSVFENFRFDMQINVLTYLCTQNSAYKFVKLLSKNIDYSKIKVELKQRVSRKEWVSTSDSILITTFPKEEPLCYTVIKYLTQQKGRDFFIYPQIKDLENIEDLTYIESEIYDKKIQMAIQLLEQNKGRYILNRKINN